MREPFDILREKVSGIFSSGDTIEMSDGCPCAQIKFTFVKSECCFALNLTMSPLAIFQTEVHLP